MGAQRYELRAGPGLGEHQGAGTLNEEIRHEQRRLRGDGTSSVTRVNIGLPPCIPRQVFPRVSVGGIRWPGLRENNGAPTPRRPILGDCHHVRIANEPCRMLGRIIAGSGRQNHDRPASFRPTMPACPNPTKPAFPHIPPWLLCAPSEPEQPPEHQGNMRPKNTPVLVGLIHDDISQVRKQPPPQVRVGENPAVEHVRISDQVAAGGPNGAAGLGGGVTVVRRGVDAGQRRVGPTEPQYCGELVVSQGFGGGEVEGAGCRVAGQVGEGGELVAQ